jgi:nucleotide-binding universal stress UspA family protein
MLPIRTILHPTDFSEPSEYAFQLACGLAWDYGARLVVLHVTTPPIPIFGDAVPVPAAADYYPAATEEQLNRMRAPDPNVRMEHLLREGNPTTETLEAAAEIDCDLIVMGTHGRTGLKRLFTGSVAEQVVRKAPCPVLTVTIPPHLSSSPDAAMASMQAQA